MAAVDYTNPVARRVHRDEETSYLRGPVNVGDMERWASSVGGGILVVKGLTRGTLGGLALAAIGGMFLYRGMTGHCSLYQALGIDTSEEGRGPSSSVPARQGEKVEQAVTINRSPADLYTFWRNFENLPHFMDHLVSVKTLEGNRSHWVAKAPLGLTAEWDAEIHTERPNELIGWRSIEGSEVDTAGSVHFVEAPGGRGTEVRVSLKYNPPAGKVGIAIAKIFGEGADQQIADDLRRFKQLMEASEAATTRGQPAGGPG